MTDGKDEQEILKLEEARCEALRNGDVGTLGSLMADDLVHIHGTGHMDDRTAYLNGVADKFIFRRLERGELRIRIHGDTAIVNGSIAQTVSIKGTDTTNDMEGVVTQTWVRRDGGWKQNTCHMQFTSVNGKSLI